MGTITPPPAFPPQVLKEPLTEEGLKIALLFPFPFSKVYENSAGPPSCASTASVPSALKARDAEQLSGVALLSPSPTQRVFPLTEM